PAPRKYILGLTGNIASGKSTVRQYLENAGAITIDTDLLAQYTYLPSGPAYMPILDAFPEIAEITEKGSPISRKHLGRLVFSDPASLKRLEGIIYPILGKQIDALCNSLEAGLLVIEGVNLVEAGFRPMLDTLWMAVADDAVRLQRLIDERWMDAYDARTRLSAQVPQANKAKLADFLIHTDIGFEETYTQVEQGLNKLENLLPPVYWKSESANFSRLTPSLYESVLSLFCDEDLTDPSVSRFYSLLSKCSAFLTEQDEAACLTLYKLDSQISLLLSNHPQHRNHIPLTDVLDGLEGFSKQHQVKALLIPADLLGHAEAKRLNFFPGDTPIPGMQPEIVSQVMRKNGLMPAEIYLKIL
ncbi:MAG TPA: dephospho-CoA kinase, partial [Anaerolineaceae bacterium]|nr:dephospho-CoA kinase [Anaerolineaceae bacterium]